jgi:hypothetical protein
VGSGKPAARAAIPAPTEQSWGRVLVTTVKLSAARRLRAAGFGPRRGLAARWRRLAALALAPGLVTVAVLWFTGTAFHTVRALTPPRGVPSLTGAAATRSQAAAWVADQVSDNAMIACYPDMCAALQAQGVTAGRMLPLSPGATDPAGASVMVTSPSIRSQFAEEYAPELIASFGSGGTRIDVRAVVPGGASAYHSALRADIAARRAAGSELLRNWRLEFTAADAAQLRAGEVDTRLLTTLAALASQYSLRVTAFGDASPGAPALFREATITGTDLAGAQALVRAQSPPYLPAHIAIVHQAADQTALAIEFAAPSPLGLLTAVLVDER